MKICNKITKFFKILELYEFVKNSENISNLLPQTIDRLKSLEALHNKGKYNYCSLFLSLTQT